MTNLIILAVMIITLMGAATYGLAGAMRSLQTSIQTLIIQDRLEEAAQGIIANIVFRHNECWANLLCAGARRHNQSQLCQAGSRPMPKPRRGVKFLYCPL